MRQAPGVVENVENLVQLQALVYKMKVKSKVLRSLECYITLAGLE